MITIILSIIITVAILSLILNLTIKSEKRNKAKQAKEFNRQEIEKQTFAKNLIRWNKFVDSLIQKNGNINACFSAICNTFSDCAFATVGIYIFSSSHKIIITKTFGCEPQIYAEIPFSTLLDVEIIIKDQSDETLILETKTSLSDMVKRSVVGAALGGITGAFIGASTAKRTSIISSNKPRISHSLLLRINSQSLPSLRLDFYSNESLMNHAIDILKIIILGETKQQEEIITSHTPIEKDYIKTLANIAENKGKLTQYDVMRQYGSVYAFNSDAILIFSQFMTENHLTIETNGDNYTVKQKK